MAKYNYKEFANIIGLEPKHIPTYISRGSIVADVDEKTIDSTNPTNKLLIEKRKNKRTEKQLVAELKKTGQAIGFDETDSVLPATVDDEHTKNLRDLIDGIQGTEEEKQKIPIYEQSVQLLKHLDTLKRKREISLLELKEQKMRAEMIPSALIQPLLLQHNQSIVTGFLTAIEGILRIFSHKMGISNEDRVEIKAKCVDEVNAAIKSAVAMTISSVDSIVDDFAETRSKGDRR